MGGVFQVFILCGLEDVDVPLHISQENNFAWQIMSVFIEIFSG